MLQEAEFARRRCRRWSQQWLLDSREESLRARRVQKDAPSVDPRGRCLSKTSSLFGAAALCTDGSPTVFESAGERIAGRTSAAGPNILPAARMKRPLRRLKEAPRGVAASEGAEHIVVHHKLCGGRSEEPKRSPLVEAAGGTPRRQSKLSLTAYSPRVLMRNADVNLRDAADASASSPAHREPEAHACPAHGGLSAASRLMALRTEPYGRQGRGARGASCSRLAESASGREGSEVTVLGTIRMRGCCGSASRGGGQHASQAEVRKEACQMGSTVDNPPRAMNGDVPALPQA